MLGLRPRVGVHFLGLWPRVEAKFLWFLDQNLNLYVTILGQNKNILSLQSQFRTFFGPTDQDFMGKCRGNGYMHLVIFWLIGGWFSKGKYKKYTFYEKQKYGLKIQEIQKLGCTIANVVSRGFRGYRTLWGSGRPTLCNIPLTRFGGNTEIRLKNTRNTKIRVHHRKRRVQRFSWV